MTDQIPAHAQKVTSHYVIHYPDHAPREGDPNYAAFNAYHRANEATSFCYVGKRLGFDQCADATGLPMLDQPGHLGLELHHKVLEFSLINAVDLAAVALDFPDLTDEAEVAAWAETDANFMWLCAKHHRGAGGIHHAAAADWTAELYIRDLIGPFEK
jgi:hypothetical protein